MSAQHEVIEYPSGQGLPDIDLVFTGCRTGPEGYAFDIIDFPNHKIDRWKVPWVRNKKWPAEIKANMYPENLPLGYTDVIKYCDDHYMTPHTTHLAPQGKLFTTFGVSETGFGVVVIDTHSTENDFVTSHGEPAKLFVSTGDFDSAYRHFYFATWPMTNTPCDAEKTVPNSLEIKSLDIDTLEERHVYTLTEEIEGRRVKGIGLPKSLHQITVTEDGRYIVCAPYNGVQNDPVPGEPADSESTTSGPKFKHRMVLENVITIDLQESKHWFTEIPVPVPAHIEFDLDHQNIFYASAHNIAGLSVGTVLEGTATLFRLAILDGKTEIVGSYTDDKLFRITQHSVFRHNGQILVALTCVPNRLVIIDAETMTLWRDVKLFEAAPILLSDTGALSPESAFSVYSVNPSADGKFIVLENASDFIVYDMNEDRVLDVRLNRCIPKGYGGRGHTRTAGQ